MMINQWMKWGWLCLIITGLPQDFVVNHHPQQKLVAKCVSSIFISKIPNFGILFFIIPCLSHYYHVHLFSETPFKMTDESKCLLTVWGNWSCLVLKLAWSSNLFTENLQPNFSWIWMCIYILYIYHSHSHCTSDPYFHRIGWWDNLQESPIFNGKKHGFRLRFSQLNQSNDTAVNWMRSWILRVPIVIFPEIFLCPG